MPRYMYIFVYEQLHYKTDIWFKLQQELEIQFTYCNQPKDTSVQFILQEIIIIFQKSCNIRILCISMNILYRV